MKTKITPGQHANIRRLHADGFTQASIARDYGVSQPQIGNILNGDPGGRRKRVLLRQSIHAAEQAVIAAAEAAYLHEESVAPEDRGESAFIRRAEDLILTICDAVDALRKARTA